jgi:subtilisin-like proprotein convertase family protein
MTKKFFVSRRPRFAAVAAAAAGAAVLALPGAASAATLTFENPTPIAIPSFLGPATPYPATINVGGFSGPVEDVDATIRDWSHTCPADTGILLVGPTGERTILLSDAGGECEDAVNTTVTFDDEAASNYPCGSNPSGTFKPTDFPGPPCINDPSNFPPPAPPPPYPVTLSVFDGTDPNGDWQLYVIDDVSDDSGSIANGWSLTVTAPVRVDRTLTLDTNKGKVEKGRKVRLTGQIDAPGNEAACEPNQTVELQRKPKKAPDTAFSTFDSVQTDATGNFSDKVKVKKTRIYRAQVRETEACDDELSNTQKVRVQKPKAAKEA